MYSIKFSTALLQQKERWTLRSKAQSRMTWHGSKAWMLKNVLHRPGTSIHGLLEKKLRANTAGRQAHQVEIHFKLHQKSHAIKIFFILSVPLILNTHCAADSVLCPSRCESFERVSWFLFTKRKLNLISDRVGFNEIANRTTWFINLSWLIVTALQRDKVSIYIYIPSFPGKNWLPCAQLRSPVLVWCLWSI